MFSKKNKNVKTIKAHNNFFLHNKNLLWRIAFTLLIIIFIRFMSHLTVPGVIVKSSTDISNNEFLNLISMLGGGTIGKFSIVALGVSPYITASIIVQLLSTDVVPVLTRWSKSGENGRKKLDLLTRFLTIPFALMQGTATIFTMAKEGIIQPKWDNPPNGAGSPIFYYLLVPSILLAGTMFMLWLGDQITRKGIGNGVSIIIFSGIIARLPFSIKTTFDFWLGSQADANLFFEGLLKFIVYMIMFLFVILFVVILNETERHIPIRQTGSGLSEKGDKTFMPLKLNSAGVIPVIFASALISAPMTISQIIQVNSPNNGFVHFVNSYLSFSTWSGIIIYMVLVILFSFLYSQVQINPQKIADNFQKSGKFIPGIKPGRDTEKYLTNVINRLSTFGSIGLALIAVLPYVISKVTNLPSSLAIGGTGLIIMVTVSLQTVRQVKGRLVQQYFAAYKNIKKSEKDGSNDGKGKSSNNPFLW